MHQSSTKDIEIIYEADEGFDEGLLMSRRQEVLAHLGEPINLSFRRVEQIPLTAVGKHLLSTSDVPVELVEQSAVDGGL